MLKMNSEAAASHLIIVGINLYNRHIFIRYYDDVLAEEYSEYLQYNELMSGLRLTSERSARE